MSEFDLIFKTTFLLLETRLVNNEWRNGTELVKMEEGDEEYKNIDWIELIFTNPFDFHESYVATFYLDDVPGLPSKCLFGYFDENKELQDMTFEQFLSRVKNLEEAVEREQN